MGNEIEQLEAELKIALRTAHVYGDLDRFEVSWELQPGETIEAWVDRTAREIAVSTCA